MNTPSNKIYGDCPNCSGSIRIWKTSNDEYYEVVWWRDSFDGKEET